MMDVALSIMALVAGGVTLELFATSRAPLGYQDDSGFHFGPEPKVDDVHPGNPSWPLCNYWASVFRKGNMLVRPLASQSWCRETSK